MTLEKQFEAELIKNCEEAQKLCGYNPSRFIQTLNKFGGIKTAREIIRKGRLSDGFEKLHEVGCIDLTMEATLVQAKYGELFTDEEVNSCFEVLCEHGFYR